MSEKIGAGLLRKEGREMRSKCIKYAHSFVIGAKKEAEGGTRLELCSGRRGCRS